ncbi:MAG TPA: stage III sporulation protein AA, partial [Clostridia bacterium]|nr:stage III sporulation protein AA [Clostridia bacterium]
DILPVLPARIRKLFVNIPVESLGRIVEIRLRQNQPLILGMSNTEMFLKHKGGVAENCEEGYIIGTEDIEQLTHLISRSSIYALEEELRNGFLTLPGGHRVGITGKVLLDKGRVKTIRYFSGFNIRVSHEIKGAADGVLRCLVKGKGEGIYHTILVSPPRCGKTTLLRDIIRRLSEGVQELNIAGLNVGVVDERSEIAGCYKGIPQRDLGPRADVIDGCNKAEGVMMLLRSMSPDVIAVDEIGREEDMKAIGEVLNAGVTVLATAHGSGLNDIKKRPALKYLVDLKVIQRFVILGHSRGIGTVEDVIDGVTLKSL